MARVLLLALLGLFGSGCYRHHERAPLGVDPPHDAAVADTSGPDAPVVPCTWTALEPWQLTSPPGDQRHSDVLPTSAGYLVAYGSSLAEPPEAGRYLFRISTRGILGERVTLFDAPRGTFLGGVGLATDGDEVLAATYDDAGCAVRRLSGSGTPIAPTSVIPRASCVAPEGTPGGFLLYDRPGDADARRFRLDASASVIVDESAILAPLDRAFWWARAYHADRSTLLVGMTPGVEPERIVAQRIDPAGTPAAALVPVASPDAANRVRAVATPDGALVGWLEAPSGDPTSQERAVRLVPVDRDGNVVGAVRTISGGVAYRDAGWSIVRSDHGVLASWVESEPGDPFGRETRVVLAVLDDDGAVQARLELAGAELARSPIVRARANEGVVVYTAATPRAHQAFVVGLECR